MLDILPGLSKATNKALASDTANQKYLQSLGDICLRLNAELPTFSVDTYVSEGEISLRKNDESATADIVVHGKAIDLLKLMVQPAENPAALRSANIRVEGDAALLLELSRVIKRIEIDWEGMLAEQIGETPAVIIGRAARQTKSTADQVQKSATGALKNWITGPNSEVVTRDEHTQLKAKVRELQYSLDRLEARLRQNKKHQQAAAQQQ